MKKKNFVFGILLLTGLCAFQGLAYAATYYMPDDCANLQACFSMMHGRDILFIRDGTYKGSSNAITDYNYPPDGSSGAYTIVKAEHDGAVTFDGENSRAMFNLRAWIPPYNHHYLEFRGINWIRPGDFGNAEGAVLLNGNKDNGPSTYIKFVRCSAQGGTGQNGAFNMNYIDHLLLEECFSYGDSRYGMIAFQDNYVIFRRCVVRLDKANGGGGSDGWPIANFQIYDTQYAELQNCIAIDTDDQYFEHFSELEGAFDTHTPNYRTTHDVYRRGCIALNINMDRSGPTTGWYATAGTFQGGQTTLLSNTVFWDIVGTVIYRHGSAGSSHEIDHCTFGDISGNAITYSSSTSNNILTGISQTAISGASSITNNDFFGNGNDGSRGSDYLTSDPIYSSSNPGGALKYITRVEPGSGLEGAGSSGSDIGANIMTRIGVSGTFYGETGYNTDTGEPLWPFPYEDVMKTVMSAYSPSGGPSGTRGFSAPGNGLYGGPITLTSYIWEYLGNLCPSEICTSSPQCSDGIDNDGDGHTDYPDDAGCSDADGIDESNCGDAVCEGTETCQTCSLDCSSDTDDDGYDSKDCGGDDCDDDNASVHPGAAEVCTDSVDNDCDGNEDCQDSDCSSQPACQTPVACSGADTSGNGVVETGELTIYIASWKSGDISIGDLMAAISDWKNGC